MTEKEKLELAEEIMDVEEDTLSMDTLLDDIDEWDSFRALFLTIHNIFSIMS